MNNELHRHLDGEIPAEELGPADRERADDWERMVASFRTAAPRGDAPAWLEGRVMAEIASLPERGPLRRLAQWLVSPAPIRVSPLTVGLAAAAIAALTLFSGRAPLPPAPGAGASAGNPATVVYVQFMLDAPGATSVAVAGDFNDWQPSFTLDDPDGDGIWSGRVPVRPGVHGYMFLVDDSRWQTDPNADRYRDDGFGNQNAVLAVGASS